MRFVAFHCRPLEFELRCKTGFIRFLCRLHQQRLALGSFEVESRYIISSYRLGEFEGLMQCWVCGAQRQLCPMGASTLFLVSFSFCLSGCSSVWCDSRGSNRLARFYKHLCSRYDCQPFVKGDYKRRSLYTPVFLKYSG